MINDSTLNLFADADAHDRAHAPAVGEPEGGSAGQTRDAAVIAVATDASGAFWPLRAVRFILALDSRAARAEALAHVPANFRVMVESMVVRAFMGKGRE